MDETYNGEILHSLTYFYKSFSKYPCSIQITPSSFTAKDALTSNGAQLVVRERPSTVVVQRVNGQQNNGNGGGGGDQRTVTASAGEEVELECIVSGGNPPAKISWLVGSKTIRYELSICIDLSISLTSLI